MAVETKQPSSPANSPEDREGKGTPGSPGSAWDNPNAVAPDEHPSYSRDQLRDFEPHPDDGAEHQPKNLNPLDTDVVAKAKSSPTELKDKENTTANANAGALGTAAGALGLGAAAGAPEGLLGKGFTGPDKKKGLLARIPGTAAVKRRVAFAAIGLAAAIIGTIVTFMSLLPLKVLSIVTNIQNTTSAAPMDALQKETENMENDYYAKYVLPGLKANRCKSTIDTTCVASITGNNPVINVYKAWHEKHLETTMAKKYGIVFGKQGNQLYMNINGEEAATNGDLESVMNGDKSIFDLEGTKTVSPTDARLAIDDALKDSSLWDKAYFRFKFGKLIEEKYGVKLCTIACNYYDKFLYPLQDKIVAAKANIIMRVLSPVSENYGIMMQCVIAGGCDTLLDDDMSPEDVDRLSPFQQQLRETLLAAKAADPDALDAAVKTSNALSTDGFTEVITKSVIKNLVTKVAGETAGEAAADTGVKAIPIVGWVIMAAQAINMADKAGPALRMMSYAINAAAAVQLYMTFQSVAAECQSGHCDETELGSFSDALSTNLSGSGTDQVDATQAPLYKYFYGGDTAGEAVGSSTSKYLCNNGKPVQSGALVCAEEVLNAGNYWANQIHNIVNIIPGIAGLSNIITQIINVPAGLVGDAFSKLCSTSPVCTQVSNAIGAKTAQLGTWLAQALVPSPFTNNMSGGRTFDMMFAGADVAENTSCRVNLGCAKLTTQQLSTIQGEQLDQEKQSFESQPILARMFSTTSPYSLISRLAIAMPTDIPTTVNNTVASIIADPLNTLASTFSDILTSDKAFADPAPVNDPFGITQYGYTSVPAHPMDYWSSHCQEGTGSDFTQMADDSRATWTNAQKQDPDTGEPLATTTDPCLLIMSTAQVGEATSNPTDTDNYDPGFWNQDPPPQGSTSTTANTTRSTSE